MESRKIECVPGTLWGTIHNLGIEIRSLTADQVESALDVLNNSFFLNETVCNATGINLPENQQARLELRELCRQVAEDGVSLIAIEKSTDAIVAVCFSKIQCLPAKGEVPFFEKFRDEYTSSTSAKALLDFMIDVDNKFNVFEELKLSCTCELMFLSTLPNWEGKGIGRTLIKYTIELARLLHEGKNLAEFSSALCDKRPQACTVLCTSLFSQKACKSQGFKVLNSVPYTECYYNGTAYSELINPLHKSCEHCIYLL